MDTMRAEDGNLATTKASREQGISEVQKTFGTLRNYTEISVVQQHAAPDVYQSSCGTGSSIIGMLEVMESYISKNLEELSCVQDESDAATGR